ncbi:hypothetical protein [Massilia sp. TS11]|uniref:hypothetical protein n=1 Tax=Massilia sp. TS11 TaxID=2908003 RepID=UPI001EDAB435|nr:hypothetical protein [Massilia sp. TS11]MCG2585208.1 hypothetical protein [Massilia sp. TS11]
MPASIYRENTLVRTIIHIGQHKTGTTSIQHFLQHNKAKLASAGLYVPESIAGHYDPSHYILNVYALNENRYSPMKEHLSKTMPKEFFQGLRAQILADIHRHYMQAESLGCKDVIWSNEGLYLLNSTEEYKRLRDLFSPYSSEIECVCCFRELASYKRSYAQHLTKLGLTPSEDTDSYRYLASDSWLFDYAGKEQLLEKVFDRVISFPYNPEDNVKSFMDQIGYPVDDTASIRLNVSEPAN